MHERRPAVCTASTASTCAPRRHRWRRRSTPIPRARSVQRIAELQSALRGPRPADLLRGQGELEPRRAAADGAGRARRRHRVAAASCSAACAPAFPPTASCSPASARPTPRSTRRWTSASGSSTSSRATSCSLLAAHRAPARRDRAGRRAHQSRRRRGHAREDLHRQAPRTSSACPSTRRGAGSPTPRSSTHVRLDGLHVAHRLADPEPGAVPPGAATRGGVLARARRGRPRDRQHRRRRRARRALSRRPGSADRGRATTPTAIREALVGFRGTLVLEPGR